MPKDRVTFKADGIVSVADFRTMVDGFADLMLSLTAETNPDAAVDWMIDELRAGSAAITSRGIYGNVEGRATMEVVVDKYKSLAVDACESRIGQYSPPVREAMEKITGVINGRIPRLFMGTPEEPEFAKIESPIEDDQHNVAKSLPPRAPRPYARAAVKGQIVTLDEKRSLYFTLQEAYTQRHIRCWPGKEFREKLGEYWAERTWIIVEGTFMRYGDSPSITGITEIAELPHADRGDWRQAVGAAPRGPEAQSISSAEAVRKVRDGET